jgi:uncharacterized protein
MKSALYVGNVRHRRFAPKVHNFRYSLLLFYIDLSEVDRVFRFPFLCSIKSPSLIGFNRKNYLGDPSKSIRESVSSLIQERLGKELFGPVRLLTQVSYFGVCFNPVSFYYCFDQSDTRVEYIIAEITNTPWLERHAYVFETDPGSTQDQFDFTKEFHVSPFLPMGMDYRWRFGPPKQFLNVHMENRAPGHQEVVFDATMTMSRKEFSYLRTPLVLLSFPLLTLKSIVAIYFQALVLKLKNVPFYPHPSHGD